MENANSKNLETALRNIDPTKAEPLAAKYKLVMDSIGSGLIDPKSDLAKSSKSYLERLASDLIDSSLMSRENQHVDVEILDRELDNVASALGLKLENINASEVAKAFDQLGAIFYELRINFRKSDYLAAYIKNAVPVKLDIASLAREMNTLWKKAANSNFFKSYLYANQDQLLTIVGQFCNGRQIEAFDTLSELNAKVAELHDPEVLQQKTGVILPDAQAQELMGTLKANQMTDAEIFKAINLVKEVNPEAFSKLKLAPNEMVVFLVGLVLDLKGGKRKNVKNGLLIEATASALDAKRAAEIADYSARLEKTIVGLREYREKNPDVATDAHIINVERNIAQLRANIVFTKFQQFMVNVQRYLASSYAEGLKNAGDFANVVADIFRRTSVNTLKQVAEKYGIQLPPDFAMLEKLDLDYQACKLDTSLKDELNQMSPDDKVLYSEFYKQFAEGKLDTSAKKEVVLHQIYEESQNLAMLSDKNEALIDRDRVAVYGLMDKYGSIDKVPANEKANVIAKLGTYFEVVKQGQAIVGKLLSTYIDVELLSPNEKVGEDKAAVAQEIAKVREYLTELGGGMEDIAQFLGKKDFKAPTENQIADSKLYSLILAKEVRPFNDKFDAVTHEVIDASNGLGFAMADLNKYGENPEYFEKMAIPPTRLFGHALGAFAGLENGIAGARDSISAEQTGLENYRNDILNGKVGVTNKYPVLKDHLIGLIDRSINRVKFLLNNADSPISLKKLDDLKKAHAELDAAYKNHLNHVLKGIITTTVIIAAAVAGGMFAAGLLVGPAAESLIMVSGTAAFGGTFASRLAMGLTNVVGLSDFSVKDEILSPKAFARDFLVSWGLAIGAFGLARGAMSGLNRGAASSRVWISRTSEKLLRGIGKARGAMSPVEWFGATEGALSKEMMKKFGVKFLTQFPQTEVENQVWEVNPLFGFVVSVLNATHGMHVDIKAVRATGAGVEKNAIVYRTATPEEFITQMEAYCSAKGATSFRAEVLPNKTIRFTVHDEVGGIVSLEVKPATTDLEPGVRVRRANGIQHENGQLVIRNAGDLAQCISRLQEQGFTVNVEGKTVKVSKGAAYSEEIKLEFEGTADVAVRTDILKVA
ncbi:hypothetical protein HZA40_01565, partial [Candidatus Peregrinibacteria bacterium]|nr:hypothetical protein [Candidatus Peregrinibacteria bacterium]